MTSHLFYRKLITKPHTFTRLTGLTPGQFRTLLHALQPHWQQLQSRKKHPGRKHGLGPLGNHLFTLLLYYRSYATYEWLAVWFHVDETTVLRSVKRLEPLLLQITTLPKKPTLSTGEVETLLIDATEQPIERPQKDQRKYYSGKKKQHTLKTEIQVSPNGKTLSVSKSFPGSVHDLTVRRQSAAAPPRAIVIADSGYQGYQHDHPCTVLPRKRTRHKIALSAADKTWNRALSSVRIAVEHAIGRMKRFRILSGRYRNQRSGYNAVFKIIARLTNLRMGF